MASKRESLGTEKQTVGVMVGMYCAGRHGGSEHALCAECEELLTYAQVRLEKCPFGPDKGPCSKCEIHCYKPELRQRMQAVMRYAGPRVMTRHPVMGLKHLVKGLRKKPRERVRA
ncbi:MAG: nitrous oxide-stimulated promoter family protein [Sedimentisphaerales bacterium]|nr:nitrous oxide-stimulated promoter family protein [Sedimentisphaerales bacterium]